MFRDCSLPEGCRSSISAHLQLQLHSNSHNSLNSYLSQPRKPPPFGKKGHQQGAFKALILLLAVRQAKFKLYYKI